MLRHQEICISGLAGCIVTVNLQKWVDSLYFYNKSANQIRLYGDMAYIFHNQKLITVIKVPENLVPDIVAIRRFKEEKGRRKHESDRRTQKIG